MPPTRVVSEYRGGGEGTMMLTTACPEERSLLVGYKRPPRVDLESKSDDKKRKHHKMGSLLFIGCRCLLSVGFERVALPLTYDS